MYLSTCVCETNLQVSPHARYWTVGGTRVKGGRSSSQRARRKGQSWISARQTPFSAPQTFAPQRKVYMLHRHTVTEFSRRNDIPVGKAASGWISTPQFNMSWLQYLLGKHCHHILYNGFKTSILRHHRNSITVCGRWLPYSHFLSHMP